MSVVIKSVEKGSPAQRAGIKQGDIILSIDENEIMDVLDYRFYQNNSRLKIKIIGESGKERVVKVKKKDLLCASL